MEIFEFISTFFELLSTPHIAIDSSGIFDSFYTVLMKDLMIPLSNKFVAVTEFIRPIFTFAVGLFVSVFGYMILAGKIKAPAEDFVWRISIIAILFWIVFDATRYEKFVIRPVMGTTTAVTKLISPQSEGFFGLFTEDVKVGQTSENVYENNRGLFMGLDVAIESVSIILKGTVESFNKLQKIKIKPQDAGGQNNPAGSGANNNTEGDSIDLGLMNSMLIVGFVGLIITGAVMVYVTAGAILMLNHVFLVLMLMIGPAFIVMAAYKPTREYAKKWMSRVLAIALTIAICSAITAFILFIQKDVTAQMCKATGSLQHSFMLKAQAAGASTEGFSEVKTTMDLEFRMLQAKLVAAGLTNAIGGGGNQGVSQSTAAVKLVEEIIQGCNEGTGNSGSGSTESDAGVNIMFQAIQYLIICLILNRLVSESANVAGAIVNSSGLTTGTSQEVSGGAQGMSGRLGAGGTNSAPGAGKMG